MLLAHSISYIQDDYLKDPSFVLYALLDLEEASAPLNIEDVFLDLIVLDDFCQRLWHISNIQMALQFLEKALSQKLLTSSTLMDCGLLALLFLSDPDIQDPQHKISVLLLKLLAQKPELIHQNFQSVNSMFKF